MQRGAQGDLRELRCHEGMFLRGTPAVYAHVGRVVMVVPGPDAQFAAHRAACFLDVLHFKLQKTPTSPEGKASAHRLSYSVYPTALRRVLEVLKPVDRQITLVVTKIKGDQRGAPVIVQGA